MMRILGALIALLLWAGAAQAQCTVPNTFINGTIIDAVQVNANFSAVTGCVNNINTAQIVATVTNFGASAAASDNTAAFNSCLTAAAAAGGACYAGGARYILLGNVTIPANTTLTCGQSFAYLNFNTVPALLLDSSHTISAGGGGAWIQNCTIIRNGMTFPAGDSTAYAGTAVSDSGANLSLTDVTILGFDRCVSISGVQPYVRRLYTDCAGSSNPAIDVENAGVNGGYFDNITLEPIGTGNYNGTSVLCPAATRPGTGFKMNGINFVGSIVSQNYRVADIEIDSYVPAHLLWTDFVPACVATYPASIGLKNNGNLSARELTINSSGIGIQQNALLNAGHILFVTVGGDCIKISSTGTRTIVGSLETNDQDAATNCGHSGAGFAINYTDVSNTSYLYIGSGSLKAVASTPYITIPSTINANLISISDKIVTDLANPSTLYGTTTVGTLVGFGTGATASMVTSNLTSPFKGQVLINTGTAPSISASSLQLTFPLTAVDAINCVATPQSGASNWGNMTLWQTGGVSGTVELFGQTLTSGPTASTSAALRMNFECNPQ